MRRYKLMASIIVQRLRLARWRRPTSCRRPCSCCQWRYRRRRPPPAAPSWPPSPPALSCPYQGRTNKPDRKRVSRNQQDSVVLDTRTNQARSVRGIEWNRRDPPLAALLRGKPVLGPLGVGLLRCRALAVALPLVAAFARVKDETTEQEQNPNNNRSKAKQRKCADLIGVGKDMSHLGASARPCLLYGQRSATTRRIGSSFSPKWILPN